MSGGDRLDTLFRRMFSADGYELSESSSPETVPGWDSLTHLNLVMAIEAEFAVSLTPAEILEMKTVGLIRTILVAHGAEL